MLSLRARRLALLVLLGALGPAAAAAPSTSAAAVRHAAPTGSGSTCSAAVPCSIHEAITGAVAGDEVIVDPGYYYPLVTTLDDPAQITIRGVAGKPRPRLLFSGAGQQGLRLDDNSLLRRVEIDQTEDAPALYAAPARVDQVILKGSSGGWSCTAAIIGGTIRDSIVTSTGRCGICSSSDDGTVTSTYRNVTAIATGSLGSAIESRAGLYGVTTVNLVNVIARGGPGGFDLHANIYDTSTTGQAKITATHSNFVTVSKTGDHAGYEDHGANQTAAPIFVQPAIGDYRQATGSPTIGAGIDEPVNGAFDFDGDPREIGTTDIGADEFVVAPTVTVAAARAITAASATLSGTIGRNGAPTTYHFEYGATTAYGGTTPATSVGSGGGAITASKTITGLHAATTYHFRLVAANAGGVTHSDDRTVTTAPAPRTTTPPPPTPGEPDFSGVELRSQRLTLAHRSIAVALRCPAAPAGHCSGGMRLLALPRRAHRRVTIGRVTFSIRAGGQAKVRLRATRAGRRLLKRVRRVRGTAISVARSDAGESRTTVTAVTIRRRHR